MAYSTVLFGKNFLTMLSTALYEFQTDIKY